MTKTVKQFSVASLVYFSLMGIYLATQAVGFGPEAMLAVK